MEVLSMSLTVQQEEILIEWTPPTDPDFDYVEIFRSDVTLPVATVLQPTTQYTDTGLTAYTTYTYTIKTVDIYGNRSAGVVKSETTLSSDVTPPANITFITESHTNTSISLNWTNPTDADFSHVNIYRDDLISMLGQSTDGTFQNTGLTDGMTYVYTLKSVDTYGNESTGTSIQITTTDTTAPSEITNLTEVHTNISATLNWVNPTETDFQRVKIYRRQLSPTLTSLALVGDTTGTSFYDTSLSPETQYEYKLTTLDVNGNESNGFAITLTTSGASSNPIPTEGSLGLKYIIDNDLTHYIQFRISLSNKLAGVEYVKNNLTVSLNAVRIDNVTNIDPSINPQVHVAKKGRIWDLHIWKLDSYGEEHRASVSVLTPEDITATDVEFTNDTVEDITMKNYQTQPLEIYKSVLSMEKYDFTTNNRLLGQSGNGRPNVVIANGKLELGQGSYVEMPFMGGDIISLDSFPFMLYLNVSYLADNSINGMPQFTFEVGSNKFYVNSNLGVTYESSLMAGMQSIFPASEVSVGSNAHIMLEVKDGYAAIHYNGNKAELTDFDFFSSISHLIVGSTCDSLDATLLDDVIIHASRPYKLDSKAPSIVQGVIVIPDDQQLLVEWDANHESDLAGYNVYVNGTKDNNVPITGTNYRVMNLVNGTTYQIMVSAVDTAGNESPTFNVISSVPSSDYDTTAPLAPVGVMIIPNNEVLHVSWNNNAELDLAGYNVYVNGLKNNTNLIQVNAYDTQWLQNGQRYTITVTAVDASNNESLHSISEVGTPVPDPTKEVMNVEIIQSSTGISLTWDNPSYLTFDGTKIYRTESATNNKVEIADMTISMQSFIDTDYLAAGDYIYEIVTKDIYGNESEGIDKILHLTAPSYVESTTETAEFDILVGMNTDSVSVSVNPTWTYTRSSTSPSVFHVHYENTTTGDSFNLPDVTLSNILADGSGILPFKSTEYTMTANQSSLTFSLEHKDAAGVSLSVDSVIVNFSNVFTQDPLDPLSSVSSTKISGLIVSPQDNSLYVDPLHLVDTTVTQYVVSIDGGTSVDFVPSTPVDNKVVLDISTSAVDWSIAHVFSVSAKNSTGTVWGQQEFSYDPMKMNVMFTSYDGVSFVSLKWRVVPEANTLHRITLAIDGVVTSVSPNIVEPGATANMDKTVFDGLGITTSGMHTLEIAQHVYTDATLTTTSKSAVEYVHFYYDATDITKSFVYRESAPRHFNVWQNDPIGIGVDWDKYQVTNPSVTHYRLSTPTQGVISTQAIDTSTSNVERFWDGNLTWHAGEPVVVEALDVNGNVVAHAYALVTP